MDPMTDASSLPDTASLVLADSLDMTAAAPLKAEMLTFRGAPLTVDASGVRRVGAQCLQVLLSAQAAWEADGQPWRVSLASEEFADAVRLMGCPDLLSETLTPSDFAPLQD